MRPLLTSSSVPASGTFDDIFRVWESRLELQSLGSVQVEAVRKGMPFPVNLSEPVLHYLDEDTSIAFKSLEHGTVGVRGWEQNQGINRFVEGIVAQSCVIKGFSASPVF